MRCHLAAAHTAVHGTRLPLLSRLLYSKPTTHLIRLLCITLHPMGQGLPYSLHIWRKGNKDSWWGGEPRRGGKVHHTAAVSVVTAIILLISGAIFFRFSRSALRASRGACLK